MPRLDTLWYEIDARTKGFDENITGAKKKLQDFTDYAATKPVAVLGALSLAIVAVGVAATKMASDIDESMRRVSAAFPLGQEGAKKLRDDLEELSRITPRSQAELAKAMEEIAKRGVSSTDELSFRLRKAVDIADASGADLTSVIEGLDNVADAFKLSAGDAADELTRIFGAAQGKVALTEVFAVLERGGSVLANLGVKASEAGEAMVALIDAGIPRRQAGTVLQTILDARAQAEKLAISGTEEQKKAAKIVTDALSATSISANGFTRSLAMLAEGAQKSGVSLRDVGINTVELNAINRVAAASANDHRTAQQKLTDAVNKMSEAAATTRGGAAALSQFLKNELSAVLIDLGNTILPSVIRGLRTVTELMRGIYGTQNIKDEVRLIEAQERLASAARGVNATAKANTYGFGGSRTSQQLDEALGPDGKGTFATRLTPEEQSYVAAKKAVIEYEAALNAAANARRQERAGARAEANARKEEEEANAKAEKARIERERAAAIREQTRTMVDNLRQESLTSASNRTRTLVDDAQAQVAAMEQKIAEIKRKGGAVPGAALSELDALKSNVDVVRKREAQAAADRLNAIVDAQTVTNVDNLTHALEQLQRELREIPGVTEDNIRTITDLQTAVIAATKASEDSARQAGNVNVDSAAGGMGKMKELLSIQESLEGMRSKVAYGSAAWKIYDDAIKNVIARIKQLQDVNAGVDTSVTENTRKIQEQARAIQQGVDGAVQLAEAFGLVDHEVANTLRSIGQIAAGIGPLKDAISMMKAGTGGIGGVIGAALPIAGAVATLAGSLFGKSEAEKERERLTKENTNALRHLTESVGDLARINVTGVELAKYQGFLSNPALKGVGQGLAGLSQDAVNRQIGAILTSMSLTAEGLKEFAKQFGVTVGTGSGGKITAADLDALRAAMAAAEITKFAQSFSGQMQQMNAELALFDLTKPIDQFEALRKALSNIAGGGGLLSKTLAQFDLTTSEGLKKAQEALQDLFGRMQSGALTATDLGGLTPQEFLDAILKTQALLKAQGATTGLSGTGGFNVDRQITEVTGSRLAALLSTANTFAEQTAMNTAIIASILSGGNPISVSPPSISASSGGIMSSPGGASIVVQQLTVEVSLSGTLSQDDARKVGSAIAESTVDALDKELAARLNWKRRAVGVRGR